MAHLRLALDRLRWLAIELVVEAGLPVRYAVADPAADWYEVRRLIVAVLLLELLLATLVYSFLRLHGQA